MDGQSYRATLIITRIMLFVAGLLVFAVGISLYLFTEQTDRYFAWTVSSLLTAAFLGGSYWSAAVLEFLSSREQLWVNSRPSIPAVTLFTFLTLLITLVHIDKFHFDAPLFITRAGTWFWLIVYASVPIILTVLFILQVRAPGEDAPRAHPLTDWSRTLLILFAAIFLILGTGLLIAPVAMAPIWPWPLSALTGRAVGAWLIGIGTATGQAAWENDLLRVRAVMASLIAYTFFQILALMRYSSEVSWSSPSSWFYVLSLLLLGRIGIHELLRSQAIADSGK